MVGNGLSQISSCCLCRCSLPRLAQAGIKYSVLHLVPHNIVVLQGPLSHAHSHA